MMEQLENQLETTQNYDNDLPIEVVEDVRQIIENDEYSSEQMACQIVSYVKEQVVHSGPLPSPEAMLKYHQIPGLSESIIKMAESEQAHRHEMEAKLVNSQTELNSGQIDFVKGNIKLKSRQQVFGFVVIIGILILAGYCLLKGKGLESLTLFLTGFGSFAFVMFTGKKDDTQKEEDKQSDE